MLSDGLQKKVDFAIRLLRRIPQDGPIELAYSGGKDSDVILTLARMAGIPFKAIYKNTTIDPPGTVAHAVATGAAVIRPAESFFDLIRRKGLPTRRARFCCSVLKEYKIHDNVILGVRRSESAKRAELYKEPISCRVFSRQERVQEFLPISEWLNADVAEFVDAYSVRCHPLYYDDAGGVSCRASSGLFGVSFAVHAQASFGVLGLSQTFALLC